MTPAVFAWLVVLLGSLTVALLVWPAWLAADSRRILRAQPTSSEHGGCSNGHARSHKSPVATAISRCGTEGDQGDPSNQGDIQQHASSESDELSTYLA